MKGGVQVVPNVIASSAELDHKIPDEYGIAAQRAYDRARKAESKITNDMLAIADKTKSRMSGLETDTKTGTSTANKIDRWREKMKMSDELRKERMGLSDAEAIGSMGDIVRYTYVSDNDNMVGTTKTLLTELQDKGYQIEKIDNKYLNPDGSLADSTYKAIHIDVVSDNGQRAEIQIHTQESLDVKNLEHPLKEKLDKLPDNAVEERRLLEEEQKRLSRTLGNPKDIEKIHSVRFRK